ncbi:hypothetical protein Ccrd_025072 [Cynara cardunculus var. scolymus]|uniref:Uncharacterized protein n=1 Tax=Cynara cardunculus var. scolymus TaxID=59895 RepID=A0A124SAI8_CYNCS|nr:hypothetical protein Ccrd_025072 [Cynara cardunculus var. scolymus]
MKLNLTTGMTPNLNVSAALLGFVCIWVILVLNKKTYEMARGANSPGTYKELLVGWMTGYSFLSRFAGLFVLIPLRKEANQGVCQVLFSQFLVGNLSVVFHWKRRMWICSIPYFRIGSLYEHVRVLSLFLFLNSHEKALSISGSKCP